MIVECLSANDELSPRTAWDLKCSKNSSKLVPFIALLPQLEAQVLAFGTTAISGVRFELRVRSRP